MAYELHIERERDPVTRRPEPILETEWRIALAAAGLRAESGDVSTVSPKTGAVIRLSTPGPDAAVFIQSSSSWLRVFRFTARGSIVFRPGSTFDQFGDPVREAARRLAAHLHARIVGDDGEIYD